MGLRRHGDLTVSDPITGNPFNDDVLMFNQIGAASPGGTDKKFPGYASQMDQLLYKDIVVSGAPADSGVTVYFSYATRMSTQHGINLRTRTGWFFGDPLGKPAVNDGNFISCEANGTLDCPVDSFEVYIGAPVDTSWIDNKGKVHSDVYDPLRRWFNEVLRKGQQRWLYAAVGNHSEAGKAVAISAAEKAALTSPEGKLRIVFRVQTNRGFEDEDYGQNFYSSLGKGAAQVDDIMVADGSGSSPVTIGTFESGSGDLDVDNTSATAWHSTGKPPAIYFHPHQLASLTYEDLCGAPGSPFRVCNMNGVVISMGDHDNGEAAGGAPSTTESEGIWGMMSPTICLKAPPKTKNDWDLTGEEATATQDYYVWFEIYTGVFGLFTGGNFWNVMMQSYPAQQADGVQTWGPPFGYIADYDNVKECFQTSVGSKEISPLLSSSNASGIPDSIRIGLRKEQQCYRFVGSTGCSPTDGAYCDNVALLIVDGQPSALHVDIGQWFNDTFPVNEDPTLPGTVNFDTCAAYVRTGLNICPTTGASGPRFHVPGDSVVMGAAGDSIRIDMVFRIRPGVGNYVTVGDPTSGLRVVPTSPTAVAANDGTFWDEYRKNPGEKSAGAHPVGGWDPLTWNSARCDSAESNYWPVFRRGLINVNLAGASWQSTYHELDPHYGSLGVAKNRCFVIDTTLSLDDPNVQCDGGHPAYLDDPGIAAEAGWDGTNTTIECTSILPDGQFTPGTAFQYFFRREDMGGLTAGTVTLLPDTAFVYPQPLEQSLDGHRWQQFGVLPDRWKDPAYGGGGLPCILYIDAADRRGDEMAWVSIADTIGLTSAPARGSHNGWAMAPPGADVNSPAYRVNKNAQPGTQWDMYGVKGAETGASAAGSIGSRYAPQDPSPANKVHGKYSKQGPTDKMLASYYRLVLLLTGDLSSGILGPYLDRAANDVKTLENFLLGAPDTAATRGIWVQGSGFVEDNFNAGLTQEAFSTGFLGMDLRDPYYRAFSLNPAAAADLVPGTTISPSGEIFGVRDRCGTTLDVLDPSLGSLAEATAASHYQPYGANAPYVSGVYKPPIVARPWFALTDGFGVRDLTDRFDANGSGRRRYYGDVAKNILYRLCAPIVEVGIEPPGSGSAAPFANLMRSIGPNPLVAGEATVRFELAKTDRAQIRIYDVSGRLVRTLADRLFPAGEQRIAWDGADDHGRMVPRGVYFARVRYLASRFEDTKRVVMLR